MSLISAAFTLSPLESRRYLLDYSLDLAVGENLIGLTFTITSPSGELVPTLLVTNVVLAPAVNGVVYQATFFVSGGTAGQTYEIDFLATTSIAQIIETVVAINSRVKV